MHLPRRRTALARARSGQAGFTLIELLVVITVLGVLAAIVLLAVGGFGDDSRERAVEADAQVLRTAEEAYCARHGRYAEYEELEDDRLIVPPPPTRRRLNTIVTGDDGDCGEAGSAEGEGKTSFEIHDPTAPTEVVATLDADDGIGDRPQALALNPTRNRLYVANVDSNSVSVINTLTNTHVTNITGIANPRTIAVNPENDKVYVGEGGAAGGVVIIDGATNIPINDDDPIPFAGSVGTTILDIVVNTRSDETYVCGESSTLMAIDAGTNAPTSFALPGAAPCTSMAVNNANGKLYIQRNGGVTVVRHPPGQPHVVTPITVAGGIEPAGPAPSIAVNETTNRVYVVGGPVGESFARGRTWVFDGDDQLLNGGPIIEAPAPAPHMFRESPIVDPRANRVFVVGRVNLGRANVGRFDGDASAYDRLVPVGPVSSPVMAVNTYAKAVNPSSGRVYLARAGVSNGLDVVDGDAMTASFVDLPAVGPPDTKKAYGIVVHPTRHTVYVTSGSTPGVVRVLR